MGYTPTVCFVSYPQKGPELFHVFLPGAIHRLLRCVDNQSLLVDNAVNSTG